MAGQDEGKDACTGSQTDKVLLHKTQTQGDNQKNKGTTIGHEQVKQELTKITTRKWGTVRGFMVTEGAATTGTTN